MICIRKINKISCIYENQESYMGSSMNSKHRCRINIHIGKSSNTCRASKTTINNLNKESVGSQRGMTRFHLSTISFPLCMESNLETDAYRIIGTFLTNPHLSSKQMKICILTAMAMIWEIHSRELKPKIRIFWFFFFSFFFFKLHLP